jgi:hypothetical protein
MKNAKKMLLNVLLILCAVGTLLITFIKESIRSREKNQADSLNLVHQLEIKDKQLEIREAQSKYDSMNQKYTNEIKVLQAEYNLLIKQHVTESIRKIAGSLVGEKSLPVLKLSSIPFTKVLLLYWENEGEDPAYAVTGQIERGGGKNEINFGPLNIPAKTALPELIEYEKWGIDDMVISLHFTTTYGVYLETIYIGHNGKDISTPSESLTEKTER